MTRWLSKRSTCFKILFFFVLAFLVVLGVFFAAPSFFLEAAARSLVEDMAPEKSDVVVVIRGDRGYARALTAARLFSRGYADYIFVSTALVDRTAQDLKKENLFLPSRQQNIHSLLVQAGVPENRIILDHRPPGGGTVGEAQRIGWMMAERGFKSLIAVTSWFHTRRTAAILRDRLGKRTRVTMVAAGNDLSSPENWWRHRYQAIMVLEEYAKWVIRLVLPNKDLHFDDDPAITRNIFFEERHHS